MARFWKPSLKAAGEDGYRTENAFITGTILDTQRNKHLPIAHQRLLLPIYNYRNNILYALEKYNTLILVGETGCGKSTQLPLYLHEAGWTAGKTNTGSQRCIVCTQPRRIAATSVARRVAQEFGCALGEEVGYGVRFDFKCSDKTVIKYYTDGVLLRETLSDPLLSSYSVIIVDEAHVRSLSSDILLGLLKKIQHKRKDLRIIVTSATLDAMPLKEFFETNIGQQLSNDTENDTACILSVQGRQYPVDVFYMDKPCRDYIRCCVDTVIAINDSEDWGDVLVFLPGSEEIDSAIAMLKEQYQGGIMYFLPLYSTLSHHMQQAVFEPTPPNKRKVVLATNIAEASITIDGIRYVVDCMFVKRNYFDVRTGIDALITCAISKADAAQRTGRAGRTQEGKCYRLCTEQDYWRGISVNNSDANHMAINKKNSVDTGIIFDDFTPAEMQRTDITAAVLQLKALGIDDILHFDFLSPPPVSSMVFSLELLYSLGAIDDECRLTRIGAEMAEMPVEPRLANVLLASLELGCSEEILSIAAMLSVEYPFITVRGNSRSDAAQKVQDDIEHFAVPQSDHLTLLNIYRSFEGGSSQSWCDSYSLQYRMLFKAKEVRRSLLRLLKKIIKARDDDDCTQSIRVNRQQSVSAVQGFVAASAGMGNIAIASCGEDTECILKSIVCGYFSHVAKLGNDGQYHTLRGGGVTVTPHPTSVVARFGTPPEWIVYNVISLAKVTQLREVSKIDPKWLLELAPHYYNIKL